MWPPGSVRFSPNGHRALDAARISNIFGRRRLFALLCNTRKTPSILLAQRIRRLYVFSKPPDGGRSLIQSAANKAPPRAGIW